MTPLTKLKEDIQKLSKDTNQTELEIVEKLQKYFYNKDLNKKLKRYKEGKVKVKDLQRELRISPRKFYQLLEEKNIAYKKYNKNTNKEAEAEI
ncbi:hypothetical protein N9V96_00330 [Polaribacter sp.]|nr:hypothetical protein [Polaribacter sp.]